MSEETDFLLSIKRSLRTIAIATVALYLCLAIIGAIGWTIRVNDLKYVNKIAQANQSALCTFRADLEQRVETSREFLRDHPNGIPGIPPETIQSTIDNQERTIVALSSLRC